VPDRFYGIIDVSVKSVSPVVTRVFVGASGHPPDAFERTWNQPPGMGPFKQAVAHRIEIQSAEQRSAGV
jgi:hypothetical protein